MNYIVLDLEWNQSANGREYTCKDMPFEIIQIGAVKVDAQFNITDKWESLICPKEYKKLHFKVKEIVSITEEQLSGGQDFAAAIKNFLEWCGNDYIFCTWGSMDLTELQRNMKHFDVKHNFPKPFLFYDIQKLYSIQFDDGKSRITLKNAIEEQGIPVEGQYHSAMADSLYTAMVMQRLDMNRVGRFYSVDTFVIPKSRKEEIHLNFGKYEKYISKGFNTREAAGNDRIVRSCKCFLCGKSMTRKIKWFSTNSKTYFGLFECEEHGYIKGRIKTKPTDDDKYYAVRIMKMTDEAGADKIAKRKQNELEHRRKRRAEEKKKKECEG